MSLSSSHVVFSTCQTEPKLGLHALVLNEHWSLGTCPSQNRYFYLPHPNVSLVLFHICWEGVPFSSAANCVMEPPAKSTNFWKRRIWSEQERHKTSFFECSNVLLLSHYFVLQRDQIELPEQEFASRCATIRSPGTQNAILHVSSIGFYLRTLTQYAPKKHAMEQDLWGEPKF